MDATLLNTQKNEVFQVIKKGGIDPLQFEWRTVNVPSSPTIPKTVSRINPVANKNFYFLFDMNNAAYQPRCSPWEGMRSGAFGRINWPSCLSYVQVWAKLVQKELTTPDPWQGLPELTAGADIAVATNAANTEFSHGETERLQRGIDEIKQLMAAAVGDSREHLALIAQQMDSLVESSKHMGRRDWANLAIGTVLTLALQVALPPETVKQAFEILKGVLSGIVPLMPHIMAAGQQLTR